MIHVRRYKLLPKTRGPSSKHFARPLEKCLPWGTPLVVARNSNLAVEARMIKNEFSRRSRFSGASPATKAGAPRGPHSLEEDAAGVSSRPAAPATVHSWPLSAEPGL